MDINEAKSMLEERQSKGLLLAERWSKLPGKVIRGYDKSINFMEGINDDFNKAVMAQLYENTLHWLSGLDESTRTLQVGSFEKFVFPILRAVMANLIAADLVTVSPLDAPTGLVFYFDVLYGSSKGNIAKGSKMYDVRTGPSKQYHYTDEIIKEEPAGTGDGAAVQFTGNLTYTPVRAATVLFTDGTQRVADDGNGNLTGDVNAGGTNAIDYSTGAYDFTFAAAPGAGVAVTVDFEYNSEANANTPEIDLQLTSAPVTARTQKLRARWSLEAQQDFQAYHGISAEVELVSFMANVIAKELNYSIIQHIRQVASAGTVTWDRTPPAGVPWIWHKETVYDALVQLSNAIFHKTQRATGNWIVAATDVCNVLETITKFKGTSQGTTSPSGMAGARKVGALGEFTLYKDPSYQDGEFLMGHKGSSFLDTGYIYAPYLQLFTTGTITLDDMVSRKGMGMRTGKKVVNSGMYGRGTIVQTGGAFGD